MSVTITKVQIHGYRRFKQFTFAPQPGMNIIVGGNESGKSTLLEAMMLALTGRVNGIRASEYLNPYWFNREVVQEFFDKEPRKRHHSEAPEFRIDVYLEADQGDLQKLRGVNNMAKEDSVGLSIWAHPDPDYFKELDKYLQQKDCPTVLPAEYYLVEWLSFAGYPVMRRPKELGISLIDSRTIRSERGVDYYTRQIMATRLDPKDRSRVSVEHRKLRVNLGKDILQELNQTLSEESSTMPGAVVGLQVDQSQSASWESTLIPGIEEIPLSMAGQGSQAVAKTVLAMGKNGDGNNLIFVEEPENHLSHTRMRQLIAYIAGSAHGQQLFMTTHSSYILNRLGLDQVTLLSDGKPARFESLDPDTILYFQRLSGFDTLRMILADTIVIVEGPSDEIVFNRFFTDHFGREPMDCGIDVMSINGVSFQRCFELASLLDRPLFAIRDNDDQPTTYWRSKLSAYLRVGVREIFIGDPQLGNTLEPQIVNANLNDDALSRVFPEVEDGRYAPWMQIRKTDAALAIATSQIAVRPPRYIQELLETLASRMASE